MADFPLRRNADVTLPFRDANGNPITSGITGLTFSLFGPASATALATALAGSHFGNGEWGVTIPGLTYLSTPGTYQLVVITAGGTAPADSVSRSRWFRVGLDEPSYRTLREVLVDLSYALADGIERATTSVSGANNQLVDTYWAIGQANELVGSEVLFLDQSNPVVTTENPVQVTASTNAGVLTFTPTRGGVVASGTPYLIGGKRFPVRLKLAAIRNVLADLGPVELVGDRVTLTSVLNQYEYDLPLAFRDLRRVSWQPVNTVQPGVWFALAKGLFWDYDAERRLIRFEPGANLTFVRWRLEGSVEVAPPAKLTDTIQGVRGATVVRLAELWLKSRAGDAQDRQEAAFLYADLIRRGKLTARAGRPV